MFKDTPAYNIYRKEIHILIFPGSGFTNMILTTLFIYQIVADICYVCFSVSELDYTPPTERYVFAVRFISSASPANGIIMNGMEWSGDECRRRY